MAHYLIFILLLPLKAALVLSGKATTTISTKGQVILPKTIREQRHWEAGTRLIVEDTADGVLLKTAPVFAPTRTEDVFGSLPYAGAPKTLEEMDAGVAAEAKRRHASN
jgi:AbrB family looped-hinge helix DNA binding protein